MPTLLQLSNEPNPNKGRVYLLLAIVFLILLSIGLMSGCVSEKKRAEICASCPVMVLDRVIKKDTIIYKDSVQFLTLQGDTVRIQLPCPMNDVDIVKKKNGLKTEVKIVKGVLTAECDADSLENVIKQIRADHFTEIDSERERHVELACDKPHRTWVDTACRWFSLFGLLAIILFIVFQLFKLKKF